MPFDFGFDFRGTLGFVTDPNYAAFAAVSDIYPKTYTNVNGESVNAGWDTAGGFFGDNGDATNDPRIAGYNGQQNNAGYSRFFKVDLASGSAPGAGDYSVDLSFGNPNGSNVQEFHLLDDATILIDGDNGGSGFTTGADNFVDATLAIVTATATWTGTPVTKTFASTTAIVKLAPASIGDFTLLNHFRLTAAAAPATGGYDIYHLY